MNKKFQILLVIRWPVGGIRTFVKYVYNNIDPSIYRLTILAPDILEFRTLLKDLEILKVSYIPVKCDISNATLKYSIVFKTIMKGKYDLIHSNGLTSGMYSSIPARLRRIPHIMTLHEVFTPGQFANTKGFLQKQAISCLLPMIDIIHTVTNDAYHNLLSYFPNLKKNKKKIVIIPNRIEIERFHNAKKRDLRKELKMHGDTFLIGFLGRFMSSKGFIYLVEALEIILKNSNLHKTPYVLTFGEGGFIREEKKLIKEKGLEKTVYFMPFASDIASTIKGLDLIVIPSCWETGPLLPMEAMVAGVPIVGSNCQGLREVLQNTPSTIVPTKNSEALALAIGNEMKNPSKLKAERFVKDAKRRFDVKKTAEELEKMILNLINHR